MDQMQRAEPVSPRARRRYTPVITFLLAGLCVVLFVWPIVARQDNAAPMGMTTPQRVWDGHYGDLFTSVFAHANVIHILFNMTWLVQLGAMMEASLNPVAYLLFIVVAAFVGSSVELAVDSQTGIGFSGVVYAMFGFMWAGRNAFPGWKILANPQNLRLMAGWAVFCIVATGLHWMNIANGAHVGGLLFGVAAGNAFLGSRKPVWGVALVGLAAVTVLACVWMPWSADWNVWRANRDFDSHRYRDAIRHFQKASSEGESAPYCWYAIGTCWHDIGVDDEKAGDDAGAANAFKNEAAATRAGGPDDLRFSHDGP